MRTSKVFQSRGINKTVRDVRDERDTGYATILSHRGKHSQVLLKWGLEKLNRACAEDRMMEIQIGNEKALINVEEFMRYSRWV